MKLWKTKNSPPNPGSPSTNGSTATPTSSSFRDQQQRWHRWNQETQALYQHINTLDPHTQALVINEMLVDEITTIKEAIPLVLTKTRVCRELLQSQLSIACCILLKPITEWCLRKNLDYPPIVEELILQCIQIDAERS